MIIQNTSVLLEVNNKNTNVASLTLFWCLSCRFGTLYSGISLVDLELLIGFKDITNPKGKYLFIFNNNSNKTTSIDVTLIWIGTRICPVDLNIPQDTGHKSNVHKNKKKFFWTYVRLIRVLCPRGCNEFAKINQIKNTPPQLLIWIFRIHTYFVV